VLSSYIVGISEETNTRDNAGSHMVPSKRSFVDLSESESSSLIRILNVCEVIVEVVEGSIATGRLVSGSHREVDVQRTLDY
jgi:hypothetical protein